MTGTGGTIDYPRKEETMKGTLLFLSLLVALVFMGCSDKGKEVVPSSDDVINYTGVIKQMTPDVFLIISDYVYQGQQELFFPTNLPDSFKKDGLRVLFSGKRGEIPPNVRMIGIPLELSSIRVDIR